VVSFRDDIMPTVEEIRRNPDVDFGVHTFDVVVKTRTWSGGPHGPQKRLGIATDSTLTRFPKPHVRERDEGVVEVGPITPTNSAGGYTLNQLFPQNVAGVEFYWELTGPFAAGVTTATYVPVKIDSSRPFRWMFTCNVLLPRDRPF
jgi:hypothetical protein